MPQGESQGAGQGPGRNRPGKDDQLNVDRSGTGNGWRHEKDVLGSRAGRELEQKHKAGDGVLLQRCIRTVKDMIEQVGKGMPARMVMQSLIAASEKDEAQGGPTSRRGTSNGWDRIVLDGCFGQFVSERSKGKGFPT